MELQENDYYENYLHFFFVKLYSQFVICFKNLYSALPIKKLFFFDSSEIIIDKAVQFVRVSS